MSQVTQVRMSEINARFDKLQQQNEMLKQEIEDLKKKTNSDLEQIKTLVAESCSNNNQVLQEAIHSNDEKVEKKKVEKKKIEKKVEDNDEKVEKKKNDMIWFIEQYNINKSEIYNSYNNSEKKATEVWKKFTPEQKKTIKQIRSKEVNDLDNVLKKEDNSEPQLDE